jgi:hypothetical protein
MEKLIDTSHPVWKEFRETKFIVDWGPMEPDDWFRYIKFFSLEQLQIFTNAFPKIITAEAKIVDNIIEKSRAERIPNVMDNLMCVWGCDYSKTDKYDCIDMCLQRPFTKSDDMVMLIKYFLNQGATLQKNHVKRAPHHGNATIRFMVECGATDIDEITSIVCSHLKKINENMFENLKMILESGVDLLGHIHEISKKN